MQKGVWSEWDKRPALEPHRVPHAEADAGCLLRWQSRRWQLAYLRGTVSPGIYPGAAGAFLYTALCVPAAKRLEHLGPLRLWLLLTILCTAIKVFLDLEGTGSPGGRLLGLLGICQCACGAHNGIRRAVYGPVSPYFRICRFSELVYSPVGATAHACSGAQCTADGLLRQFLYHLCLRWFHLPAATLAYLLWTLCPSQTIYNSLVLSEPLYTALILGVLSFFDGDGAVCRPKGVSALDGVLSGTAGGVLLRWVNGVRPIAAILLIALLLWLSLLNLNRLAARNWRRWWGLCMASVLGAYVLLGPVWNARLSVRIGEEPSHTPGYSLLVGFNPDSGGRWNQEDSDRLYGYSDQPGATAQWTQEQLLADAKARILSGEIDFSKLLKQNCARFWDQTMPAWDIRPRFCGIRSFSPCSAMASIMRHFSWQSGVLSRCGGVEREDYYCWHHSIS